MTNLSSRFIYKHICASLLLLAGIVFVFDVSPIDFWVQDLFYNAAATDTSHLMRWVIYKHDPFYGFLFHWLIKAINVVIISALSLVFIAGFYRKSLLRWRYYCLFLVVAFASVGMLIGGAKWVTNIYCPNETVRYGGMVPNVGLLEHYPSAFKPHKRGRCFPAAHATGGFWLMSLYFIFAQRRRRMAALAAGLTAGWALGLFQMVRGEHYLSHTLVSMVASWLIIVLIVAVFQKKRVMPEPL